MLGSEVQLRGLFVGSACCVTLNPNHSGVQTQLRVKLKGALPNNSVILDRHISSIIAVVSIGSRAAPVCLDCMV
jgi:hypothetical protein